MADGAPSDPLALPEEVADRFRFHPATDDTGPVHEQVRAAALEFASKVHALCPPSREQSLALTAVQEAMMWGNAAVAIHGTRA